jgi:hypothetical protein
MYHNDFHARTKLLGDKKTGAQIRSGIISVIAYNYGILKNLQKN